MDVQHAGPQMMPNPLLAAGGLQPGQPPNAADLAALVAERTQGRGGFRADWRAQPAQHAPQGYSLRRELLTLTDEQIDELEREGVLNDDTYGRMRYDWKEWARPQQLAPINPNWRTWLILAGRGWGKAQDSLSTPIPTPTGWTMLCDIRVGDTVFDESGRPCRVTATFDTMPKTAYRLTFSDGTAINTCDEHQWVTWTHAERKAFLRSPYEDHACFPAEWPAWRLRRLVGHSLSREVVEQALALSRAGMSARRIAKQLGVCRQSLAPHIAAGAFIKRQPRVYDDSPGPRIRTTQEIVDTLTHGKRGDTNHSIPLALPLQLPEADLPLDPYVLGYWLGDGNRSQGSFACDPLDQPSLIAQLVRCGLQPHMGCNPIVVLTYGLMTLLRRVGVLGDKHVPAIYLRGSVEQRLALLRGLMDSDGYADPSSGNVEFCNTNKRLIDAVTELARSLGQKPVVVEGRATLNGVDCGPKWRVTWTPNTNSGVPFLLRRKAAVVEAKQSRTAAQSLRNHQRMIVKAERIDPVPMRCLTVDGTHSMFLCGEGMIPTHNTRTGAEWIKAQVDRGAKRIALVARTAADARDVMLEGESGLLNLYPEHERPLYQPSKRRVTFANGAVATLFSAKEPDLLRGPQFDCAWADELASWQDPEAWSNLMFALRLGQNPQVVVTTTPRPTPLIKALLNLPSTVVDTGNSYDNIENMAPAFFDEILGRYEGTRLGRQEIYAELLDDAPGALWKREAMIDAHRIGRTDVPPLYRIVVAIDPAVSANKDSAETGIIVAGVAANGHAYVLDDVSVREATPTEWATAAVKAYKLRSADRFVAEINNGGDLVEHTIRTVLPDAPYTPVRASRGKLIRAEPVSALYEQGRVHHVGMFGELEDQLCVAGDTLVETESGPRMISTITPGMRVWTRAGLRRVTHAWQASPAAPVWRVTTAGGRTLVATSDHPIYTSNKGFCPVGKLEIGDEVVAWNSASSAPANMARSLTGMGRAGIWAKQATISTFGAAVASMSQSLKLHLVQFRQGITSTIAMATRSTTIPQTWLRLAQPTICVNTGATIPTLPRHTELLFGTSISAARCSGPNGNGPQPATWFARAVAQRINRRGCVPSSAPPRVASDSIIAVTPLPLHIPVYDLTVEGEHEFFANGVIISNCNWEPGDPSPDRLDALVWAITELLLDGDGPPEEELPIDTGLMSMTKANDWARF